MSSLVLNKYPVNFPSLLIMISRNHFCRSNSYAKFVSFEFRNNRLSIKTKGREEVFVCGWQKTSRPEQKANRKASYQAKLAEWRSWEKRKTRDREREKKNISHVCGKGNLSQCHAPLDLTMEDRKQTFLYLKIKPKHVDDSQW